LFSWNKCIVERWQLSTSALKWLHWLWLVLQQLYCNEVKWAICNCILLWDRGTTYWHWYLQ
jgi:hypothetical protein